MQLGHILNSCFALLEISPQKDLEPMPDDEILIAVMGQTGSGKSTFINLASGSDLPVGHGLASCTDQVRLAYPFQLGGRTVTLIDTPGFDDSNISDVDILKMIAGFLQVTYQEKKTLSGLIYMHPITDTRIGRKSKYNLRMFKNLCGDEQLKNVVVATTMWNSIREEVGLRRLEDLRSTDEFEFRSVEACGGRIIRYDNNKEAALEILERLLPNEKLPLRIQDELVIKHMDISNTGAGRELQFGLEELQAKHIAELEKMKADMRAALAEKDEEMAKAIEAERAKLDAKLAAVVEDKNRLSSDYRRDLAQAHAQLQNVRAQIAAEQNRFLERERELKKQIDAMQREQGGNIERLQKQLDKLERKKESSDGGLMGKLKKRFIRVPPSRG